MNMRLLHVRLRTRDAHRALVCPASLFICLKKLPRRAHHPRKMLPPCFPFYTHTSAFWTFICATMKVPCCFNVCCYHCAWGRAPYNERALLGLQRRSQERKLCAERSKSVYTLTKDVGSFHFRSSLAIHPLRQTCGDLLRSPVPL